MKKPLPLYSIALHAFLLVTTSLVIWLALENRALQAASQPMEPLAAGVEVTPFPVKTLDGVLETLEFGETEKDTLLLVFTTTCPACRDNQPNWRAIYEQKKDDYRIVGVGLDDAEALDAYRREQGLPFPVVLPEDYPQFARDYRLAGIPTTIQVDPEGKVVEAWTGVLNAEALADLTDFRLSALRP